LDTRRDDWKLGLYCFFQIFGGGMFLYSFIEQVSARAAPLVLAASGLLAALGLIIATFSIANLRTGRYARPCAALWALQVPVVSTPVFSYLYEVGASVSVGIGFDPTRVVGVPRFGIGFSISLEQAAPAHYVAVNLVAASAVYFFVRRARAATRLGG
jgi:hypothetical protein